MAEQMSFYEEKKEEKTPEENTAPRRCLHVIVNE